MRPSESNNSKTQEHDDMHLWLQDVRNQRKIIDQILVGYSEDISYELDEIAKDVGKKIIYPRERLLVEIKDVLSEIKIHHMEIERPMYSGFYLQGICDAILEWVFCIRRTKCSQKIIRNPTGNGKIKSVDPSVHSDTYDIDESVKQTVETISTESISCSGTVLIELKPKLNSVSGIIGQVKTYRDSYKHQGSSRRYLPTSPIHCAVITYDTNTKYDLILKAENIHLIRIERNIDQVLKKTNDHQQTLSCL